MKYILALVILLSLNDLYGQKTSYDEKERNEDISFLQEALYNGHPSIFRYTSKDSFDLYFDQIRTKPDSIPDWEFVNDIKKILAKVGCIHTSIRFPKVKKRDRKAKKHPYILPYSMYLHDDSFYLKRRLNDSITDHQWAKVIDIDGHNLNDIADLQDYYWPSDGYGNHFAKAAINKGNNVSYLYRRIFGVDSLIQYNILADDKPEQITVPAIRDTNILKPKPLPKPKWDLITKAHYYRYDSVHDLGILKITSFKYKIIKTPLFYKKLFKTLQEQGVQNFVIDLRDNGGGNMGDAILLLRYLIDEKSIYDMQKRTKGILHYSNTKSKIKIGLDAFNRNVMSFNKRYQKDGVKYYETQIKPKKKYHFDQNVFVLINGYTASAASFSAAYIQQKAPAVVIGSESGGAAKGNNGLLYPKIVLPNSHINVRIPQYWIDYRLGEDEGRGVVPDYPVEYLIDDVEKGDDLEMKELFSILKHSE